MYTLKPITSLPERINLPKVMYELPRIQGDVAGETKCGGDSVDDEEDLVAEFRRQKVDPEYNLLEARQMRILKQLCELKEQVEYLCLSIRLSDVNKEPCNIPFLQNTQKPVHTEIIVNANPESPPYSILALQRIWKDTKFNVEVHWHSTVANVKSNLFVEKLLNNVNSNAIHTVDLKLIWKDVPDIQIITKVYDYSLEGEGNFLRYLTKVIENYNYETRKSINEVSNIDAVLDLCLRLSYEEPRFVNAITAKFATLLGEKPWLLNSLEPTIVDMAVWSILKRVANNKIPRLMTNWFDLCEKTFLSA